MAANNELTWTLPKGARILAWGFQALSAAGALLTRAQVLADVIEAELKVAGKDLVDSNPTNLYKIANYHGDANADAAADDGLMTYWIADRYCEKLLPSSGELAQAGIVGAEPGSFLDGESLALGTQIGDQAIQARIKFAGTVATAARIIPFVIVGDGDEPPGLVRRTAVAVESGWGTAEKDLILRKRPGERLQRVFFTDYGSGVLDKVEVYSRGQLVQRYTEIGTNAIGLHRTAREGGKTPQGSMLALELAPGGHVLSGLPLDPDAEARIALTWSTAPDSATFNATHESTVPFSSLG